MRLNNFLFEQGFEMFRVRHHGDIARVEVGEKDMDKVMRNKDKIVEKLKNLGFAYVSLDLQGYRTGIMNETL